MEGLLHEAVITWHYISADTTRKIHICTLKLMLNSSVGGVNGNSILCAFKKWHENF